MKGDIQMGWGAATTKIQRTSAGGEEPTCSSALEWFLYNLMMFEMPLGKVESFVRVAVKNAEELHVGKGPVAACVEKLADQLNVSSSKIIGLEHIFDDDNNDQYGRAEKSNAETKAKTADNKDGYVEVSSTDTKPEATGNDVKPTDSFQQTIAHVFEALEDAKKLVPLAHIQQIVDILKSQIEKELSKDLTKE